MTSTYAVIDLETTGPSYDNGGRIIQIGVLFVVNSQIIKEINVDIQPLTPVPASITRLTGITDEQLAGAPTFKEVAAEIWASLTDTIIVAHNVNFDYNFLNKTFQSEGFPAMTHPALDTVELIRVLFPTEQSYKLAEFSAAKGIKLAHAHTAYADAKATAAILLLCQQKIKQLPETLFEQLRPLFTFFVADTGKIIQQWQADNAEAKHGQATVHKAPFTLIKQVSTGHFFPEYFGSQNADHQTSASGQQFIRGNNGVALRPLQQQMVADIISFQADADMQNAFITAGSGSGKTLSYFMGALGNSGNSGQAKVMVATPTLVLQHQLLSRTLPLLANLLGRPLSFAQLKSADHYIDLTQFSGLINYHQSNKSKIKKRDAMISMALMVWLSETNSGDKNELNRGLMNEQYWQLLESFPKLSISDSLTKWGNHAFYAKQWEISQTAEIVVTNYAYLFKHLDELQAAEIIAPEVMLVFDECHQLPEKILQTAVYELKTTQIEQLLFNFAENLRQMNEIFVLNNQNQHINDLFFQAEMISQQAWDAYDELIDSFSEQFQPESYYKQQINKQQSNSSAFYISSQKFKQAPWRMALIKLNNRLQTAAVLAPKIAAGLPQKADLATFRQKWFQMQHKMNHIAGELDKIVVADHSRYLEIDTTLTSQNMHVTLKSQYYDAVPLLEKFWQKLPTKNLLVSASNNVFSNPKQLTLTYGIERFSDFQYPNEFVIEKNINSFIISDGLSIEKLNERQASQYFAHVIQQVWRRPVDKIQIIFASHALLNLTYKILERELPAHQFRNVYAQSHFGNIIKMYNHYDKSESAILLGLASFNEGIHFGHGSDMLIITRLPFASPANIRELAKQDWCQNKGINYFDDVALPEMLIRLAQILGRILSSKGQDGFILYLDQRLFKSSYAALIQKSLPLTTAAQEIALEDLLLNLSDFNEKEAEFDDFAKD